MTREMLPRTKKRYEQVVSDAWIQPIRHGYRAACCDCGLVHVFDFRIYKGRVQFRAFRNERCTAAVRRRAHRFVLKRA